MVSADYTIVGFLLFLVFYYSYASCYHWEEDTWDLLAHGLGM